MVRTVMMVLDLSRRCQNNSNTNISKIINRGTNAIGHLGHAHYNGEDQLTPKKVEALADELIVDVACGYKHTCVVTSKGSVLALENYTQVLCGSICENGDVIKSQDLRSKCVVSVSA